MFTVRYELKPKKYLSMTIEYDLLTVLFKMRKKFTGKNRTRGLERSVYRESGTGGICRKK